MLWPESINSNNTSVGILEGEKRLVSLAMTLKASDQRTGREVKERCSALRASNSEILSNRRAQDDSIWEGSCAESLLESEKDYPKGVNCGDGQNVLILGTMAIDLTAVDYDSPFVLTVGDVLLCPWTLKYCPRNHYIFGKGKPKFSSTTLEQCQAGFMLGNAGVFDNRGNMDTGFNMFLTKEQDVQLGDFGLAKLLKAGNLTYLIMGTRNNTCRKLLVDIPYRFKTDIQFELFVMGGGKTENLGDGDHLSSVSSSTNASSPGAPSKSRREMEVADASRKEL
eukprot:Gb_01510 [translate_table: standard]